MPPSGYSLRQGQLIGSFLASCAEALIAEARVTGTSLKERLEIEYRDIERALGRGWPDDRSLHVLKLTGAFYREVRGHAPENADEFAAAVREVVAQFESAVTAVHI